MGSVPVSSAPIDRRGFEMIWNCVAAVVLVGYSIECAEQEIEDSSSSARDANRNLRAKLKIFPVASLISTNHCFNLASTVVDLAGGKENVSTSIDGALAELLFSNYTVSY